MPLTLHDVQRIAHLARLELGAAEEAAMLAQLNDFFGIVEQMSAVDTAGVEPLYLPMAAEQLAWLESWTAAHGGPGLVYCLTVSEAERVAGHLRDHGLAGSSRAMHHSSALPGTSAFSRPRKA